ESHCHPLDALSLRSDGRRGRRAQEEIRGDTPFVGLPSGPTKSANPAPARWLARRGCARKPALTRRLNPPYSGDLAGRGQALQNHPFLERRTGVALATSSTAANIPGYAPAREPTRAPRSVALLLRLLHHHEGGHGGRRGVERVRQERAADDAALRGGQDPRRTLGQGTSTRSTVHRAPDGGACTEED